MESVPVRRPRAAAVRARGRRVRRIAAPAVVFLLCVGVWYLLAEVLMPPSRRFLVPPPHAVWQESIANAANRDELLRGLWVTTKVSLCGLLIAMLIGMAFAVVMSLADWLEDSFYPYAILLQVIPVLAIAPLLGLLFGFGFTSRVIVCVLIALFPIITNTLFGLKAADKSMHELFTLMKAGRARRLLTLQLPAALPSIFTGLRISGGAAVVGAVVGDFFFQRGEAGLGVLLQAYSTQLLTPQLYGDVILAALLGITMFTVLSGLLALITGKWYSPTTK
ncbi:ABC transporter permease [Dactylosporangium sp. CA-092794]|uniref:ABC transporter permease n=1 Tax=Dactylosporangium sp. CA-092794 TaxID=3239929 RepID=UPI003D91EAD7